MNPTPAFSVLCSAYRTERYLRATIESVVAQTLDDWELIVVDNGMSDAIADIVRAFLPDRRIQLIRQENRQIVGGVATAAAAARGRYFVLLDSDDQLLPDFCRRTLEILESRPEIDVLCCDARLYVEAGGYLRSRTHIQNLGVRWQPDVNAQWTLSDMFRGAYPYYTAAIRQAAWHDVGGMRTGVEKVEDVDLMVRLAQAGWVVRVTPEILAQATIRGDSNTKESTAADRFDEARERLLLDAVRRSGTEADQLALDRTLGAHRYHRALRQARRAFVGGDIAGARRSASAAFRERRTVRTALVLAGLWVAPTSLARVHSWRTRIRPAAERVSTMFRGRSAPGPRSHL